IIKTIQTKSLILLALSTLIGLLIVYWLTLSIRKLTRYAEAVQAGEKVSLPYIREKELAQLASAMADMRHELEGKNYVENYLHTLTHELKSPLAAIQGAAELLNEDMEKQQQLRFINNIHSETLRLRQIVERLLKLAELEKRQTLAEISLIHTDQLINRLCADKAAIITSKQLTLNCQLLTANQVEGEAFLIQQAISNLLDNAIDFSHSRGNIEIHDFVKDDTWTLVIRDHGSGIPDFALDRIYERFYSLGRPHREQKSTGLGLSLVQEVALLHNGKIDIRNNPDHGVTAEFSIPSSQTKEK
ncbi:MAG: two-component system sensor histidine kinase CreC, partial [Gammaproteobacteria bacterium]|nr:two-component system sensor histidine kinase CreC [Gammaproteobacteria bacterium]